MKTRILAFALTCILPLTAEAKPVKTVSTPAPKPGFTYSVPDCDFEIVFPEKPFIETKCGKGQTENCPDILTFTHTISASSLNFRVSCQKEDVKELKDLTPTLLKDAARDMVREDNLRLYASDAAVIDETKTAVALAGGRRGPRDVIVAAQLWLGANSILRLEGEMAGPDNKVVNGMFADIVNSVRNKSAKPAAVRPAEAKKSKVGSEKPEPKMTPRPKAPVTKPPSP